MRPVKSSIFLIGQAADCDLVLGDQQFPDVHMYLFLTNTSVTLRWLAEGPEVTVDGRPVSSLPLRHGDRIRTGPYEFNVHIDLRSTRTRPNVRPFRATTHVRESVDATATNAVMQLLRDVRYQVLLCGEADGPSTGEATLPRQSA